MDFVKLIPIILGIIVVLFGILGGILSLPASLRKFRKALRPHGNKGVGFIVLKSEIKDDEQIVTFLIFEDLIHFLKGAINSKGQGKLLSIETIGEYYKVILSLPPGSKYTIKSK